MPAIRAASGNWLISRNTRLVSNGCSVHSKPSMSPTGRGATDALIERADLVTEMKMIKHPYKSGIGAQRGIEF